MKTISVFARSISAIVVLTACGSAEPSGPEDIAPSESVEEAIGSAAKLAKKKRVSMSGEFTTLAGAGVAGAKVCLDYSGECAVADTAGTYNMKVPAYGLFRVTITADGFVPTNWELLSDGESFSFNTALFTPGAKGSISKSVGGTGDPNLAMLTFNFYELEAGVFPQDNNDRAAGTSGLAGGRIRLLPGKASVVAYSPAAGGLPDPNLVRTTERGTGIIADVAPRKRGYWLRAQTPKGYKCNSRFLPSVQLGRTIYVHTKVDAGNVAGIWVRCIPQ